MTNGERPAAETDETRTPPATDYGIAFSPRQVAGGFAILAGLLVILVRHRRRKKG